MKVKVTRKAVLASFPHCIAIGYCKAHYLLELMSPYGYTCGMDGWHADIYDLGDVAIVTGYVPFGKRADYKRVRFYENQAINAEPEKRKKLLWTFIQEVLSE